MSFDDLGRISKEGKLGDLYDKWLYYEFPFLKEKPVKNVEIIKNKYNIMNKVNLYDFINNQNLAHRDKRKLFYVILSFMNDGEKNFIRGIFRKSVF